MQDARNNARISENIRVHTLCHRFATHHSEGSTNLRYIHELLGHKSSMMIEIYTPESIKQYK